jgi:tetratricopeptide (TPR) repeat protein
MSPEERIPNWLRILLPCLLVALLGLQPAAAQIRGAWELARTAEGTGQPGLEAAQLRKVLELEPWRRELWEQIGKKELAAGNLNAAIIALQTAERENALSADGRQSLGDAYFQSKDTASAVRIWRSLKTVEGYDRAERAQRAAGDLAGTLETLQMWSRDDPRNGAVRYQLGLLMLASQPDKALPELLEAGRLDPKLSPKVEILRRSIGVAGQADNLAYQKLIIGRALGNLDEWDLALGVFQDAARISPEYAEAWAFIGEAKQHLQQDGLADLEKAARINPKSVVVQALYSVYWRRQGDLKQALEVLRQVMAAEPDQAVWQVEVGTTVAASGDLIKALPYYQKAVQMEPGNPAWWEALAHFSVDYMVDLEHIGLPAARQALELSPNDPALLDLMGQVFFKLNDLASAERFLQRALQVDSTLADAHLHLGQVYLQGEHPGQAFESLSTASRLGGKTEAGSMARRLLTQYFPGTG